MEIRAGAGPVAEDDCFAVLLTAIEHSPNRVILRVERDVTYSGCTLSQEVFFLLFREDKVLHTDCVSRGRSAGPEIRPFRQLVKRRAYSFDSHPKMLYRVAPICRSVTEAGVFPFQ
jgi:hypothetical protein